MKRYFALGVAALLLAGYGWSFLAAPPHVSLRGFFPAQAGREAEIERAFRSFPTPERARQDLWVLTQAPHVAGTPEDYKTAQYVLSQFREAGLEARIAEYQVLQKSSLRSG
jgi:N-acetylated-alpha-linked acidic dipeptidase